MADETRQSDETRQKVVTLRSLELPSSEMESVSAGPQSEADKLTLARYQQARQNQYAGVAITEQLQSGRMRDETESGVEVARHGSHEPVEEDGLVECAQ